MNNIKTNKHHYMYFNVILTFNSSDEFGELQEFIDMRLPLKKDEGDSAVFLMNKFFLQIVKICIDLNREVSDLIKISTASDWGLFESVTGCTSLCKLGHSGKWYFGVGRDDIDDWEISLMEKYGFGKGADLSYFNEYVRNIKKSLAV